MKIESLFAGLALTLCAPGFAAGELTRSQLAARVVGNTIHYAGDADDIFEFLAPGGVIRGRSRVHGTYTAHWRIRDDATLCLEHDDPMASGCVAVVLHGNMIEYHRKDGVVEGPFPLLKGNPEKL